MRKQVLTGRSSYQTEVLCGMDGGFRPLLLHQETPLTSLQIRCWSSHPPCGWATVFLLFSLFCLLPHIFLLICLLDIFPDSPFVFSCYREFSVTCSHLLIFIISLLYCFLLHLIHCTLCGGSFAPFSFIPLHVCFPLSSYYFLSLPLSLCLLCLVFSSLFQRIYRLGWCHL